MRFACLAVLLVATRTSEGCCPPPQFESRAAGRGLELSENGGDPYSGYSRLYHDEKKGKYVKDVKVEFEKAGKVTLFVLEDYTGGRRYTVLNGNCSVKPLTGDFNRELCVKQSDYKGRVVLGLNDNLLPMDLYAVNYSNPDYDIYGEAVVLPISEGRCMRQTEMINARVKSKLVAMESAVVFNTTTSISDPSIFDIPKECKGNLHLKKVPPFNLNLHAIKIRL